MTYAAELDLDGRRVSVAGGGPEALGPITALLDAGAVVQVFATDLSTTLVDLVERGRITAEGRTLTAADLAGAALLVLATGDSDTDRDLGLLARQAGVPVSATATTGRPTAPTSGGSVTLVGGGPGDPGLLTLAGLAAIRHADVVVCDRLAPLAVLDQAPPGALVIDVAKIPRGAYTPQEQINALLVEHAQAGRRVVRLKGGDSFVFGRGGEEWQACAAAGIPVTVIPGVSSAIAAPALAGVPLTHRQLTQGFTVVSGHLPPGHPDSTLDWSALAHAGTTLVIMMGVATLPAITARLIADGLATDTPALTVADAGLPGQHSVRGTVSDIAARTLAGHVQPPAITVIGAVSGFDPTAATATATSPPPH